MSSARHRSDTRPAASRRSRLRTVGLLAAVVTIAAVAVGVVHAVPGQAARVPTGVARISAADLHALTASRRPRLSRTAERVRLEPKATGVRYATAPLNVWQAPREQGTRFAVAPWSTRLKVTGQRVGHWAEVLWRGNRVRWVNAVYLARHKPHATTATTSSDGSSSGATTSGISTAPCPDGSSTESGLTSDAVVMFRAVCNAFPALTTYGGYAPRGEHASGCAVDFMVSDSPLGNAIAEWVQAHASQLHVYDVIWSQHIWTPERASEGWRLMPDRGSETANHYDHVHVCVS
jgi:hypothetical protein